MTKAAINIEYNNKHVISDYTEFTDEEFNRIKRICEDVASGKMTYFKMKSKNMEYYFPKQILEQSIITIVYA